MFILIIRVNHKQNKIYNIQLGNIVIIIVGSYKNIIPIFFLIKNRVKTFLEIIDKDFVFKFLEQCNQIED